MMDWWHALESDKRWLVASVGAMWVAALLYMLSPLDMLPDIVPIIGWLDDLAMLVAAVLFTVHAVKKIRAETGFSGLVPDGLRPRSVQAPPVVNPTAEQGFEAELDGEGDDLGIDGYRPMSYEQIKAL